MALLCYTLAMKLIYKFNMELEKYKTQDIG